MSRKREAEEDKGDIFGCAEWSRRGVAAQGESNHHPCIWASRAVHPEALLSVFCTDLVKLLEKTNPCDRCPLQGETQSPTAGEQCRVYFGKRPNARSGLSEPHLGWRQYALFKIVSLFMSWNMFSLTFVELLPPKHHLKCDFKQHLPSLADNTLIQGYQMQVERG